MDCVYLDHHAATPLCAAALEAMHKAQRDGWANASSVHGQGRRARAWLERARAQVAEALGTEPVDVVLTSGGTEACNLGLRGLVAQPPRHVITTPIEHPAVSAPIEGWQRAGTRVDHLEVSPDRLPNSRALHELIKNDTDLVALQWVNHETGIILPIPALGEVCRERNIPLFVDATQALGKLAWDVVATGASAVAVAAPKVGGPAGAGALWVERGRELAPLLTGGSQERGRRPGSLDVVSQAGFGAACTELPARRAAMERLASQRDRLEAALCALGGRANAPQLPRVATVTNVSFEGRRGDALVAAMDLEGICAASGAACSSGLHTPSPVLRALYPQAPWRAESALRLSFGPETTERDVEAAVAAARIVLGRPAA